MPPASSGRSALRVDECVGAIAPLTCTSPRSRRSRLGYPLPLEGRGDGKCGALWWRGSGELAPNSSAIAQAAPLFHRRRSPFSREREKDAGGAAWCTRLLTPAFAGVTWWWMKAPRMWRQGQGASLCAVLNLGRSPVVKGLLLHSLSHPLVKSLRTPSKRHRCGWRKP